MGAEGHLEKGQIYPCVWQAALSQSPGQQQYCRSGAPHLYKMRAGWGRVALKGAW
jgi:hypothetical protein